MQSPGASSVLIVLPILLVLGCGVPDRQAPVPAPRSSAPSPDSDTDPTVGDPARAHRPGDEATEPDRGAGRNLVVNDPPRVAWIDGSVLRFPDGDTLQLPSDWGYTSIVPYAGGYLVTDDRALEGVMGMHHIAADGSLLDSWTTTGPALPSRDGRVAWVSLVPGEGGLTGPTLLHADSMDGGEEVVQRLRRSRTPYLTGWFRGRLVYETWGESASFLTTLVHRPQAVPRAEQVGAVRPDGAYVARLGRDALEFLHSDGQVAGGVRLRGLGRTMGSDVVWEDDQHVLTTVTRRGRQAIVRIGMRGRVSLATSWRSPGWVGVALLPGLGGSTPKPRRHR